MGSMNTMEIRLRYGLSKYAFARKIGVSWNTVNAWEKNRHKPRKSHIRRIMEWVLEVKV